MKEIGLSVTILAMALLAVEVLAPSTDVTASVSVPGTCGFTITGNLDFAATAPGGPSDIKTLTITNTANQQITVKIKGTDLSYSTYTMSVGQTKYGVSSPTTALTSSFVDLPSIAKSSSLDEKFQMSVPSAQEPGNYQQTVSFETTC